LLLFLAGQVFFSKLSAQAILENRNNFIEAESWILFEDYSEALEIYLDLLRIYPTNSNLKYRIGQCYVNIPGEKEKAIPYLEDAVKNINPKYKEGKFKEKGAPYDALYYLANAYRITNQFDKALETYEEFKKNLDTKVYNIEIVDFQIESIKNARDLMKIPMYIRNVNLGSNINEAFSEYNPVVSSDESVMVFTRALTFYNALMYSRKVNGVWSGPVNLNEQLRIDVGRDIFPTSLSSDGKTLYLYGSENYDGVIFKSEFENGVWGPLEKLNENINTKYWESHATVSNDNNKLYFTSNRKGTLGGLDIYVSQRDTTGDWGPPLNLGPRINTQYNEETPFLSEDDKNLFFSSRGHFNIGGYDIFYSSLLENGEWSTPMNVGYPLNSTDDDVFFKPVRQGYEGYLANFGPNSAGGQDIYRVELFSENHPRKFIVRGVVRIADLIANAGDKIQVSAINTDDPEKIVVVYADPVTGEYEMILAQGNYEIAYDAPEGEKVVRSISLPLDNPSDSLVVPSTILPRTDFVADMMIEGEGSIAIAEGDSVTFPVTIEPGSVLIVEHWVGDSLLSSEKFNVTDTLFIYKMLPAQGDNRVIFKSTDKFGNTTSAEIDIDVKPAQVTTEVIRPEYTRVIAKKQIDALTRMQEDQAEGQLKKLISNLETRNQQFGKVDDLVNYIKEEAVKQNIDTREVDALSLKVAIKDNVLTQAAVDYLEESATGELKKILANTDIYALNLKTWSDLEKYIVSVSGGEITVEAFNEFAENVLLGKEEGLPTLREKVLAFSEMSDNKEIIQTSVEVTDEKGIGRSGKWLQSVSAESLRKGLTTEEMADMLTMISSMNDDELQEFISKLIRNSDDPVQLWLNSIDLKTKNIKNPRDLILFLLNNKDEVPEESLYNSISKQIIAEDITVEEIRDNLEAAGKKSRWYFWLLASGSLAILVYIYLSRKKKQQK